MVKKWLIRGGIAGLLLITGAGMTTIAQTATRPGGGGPLRAFLRQERDAISDLRGDMNLTAAQKSQIRQILVAHRSDLAADAKPLVEKVRALRTAIDGGDETAIRAATKDLTDPLADAAILWSKMKAEIKPVLTADQQQKLDAFHKQTADGVDKLLDQLSDAK
jgi:Spy/CpxP family protein refolding chaperone